MKGPEADHLATIDWRRGAWSDKKGKYSRQHTWLLAGTTLKASETGAVTPPGYHDKTPIDPYNMFVATVASASGSAYYLAGSQAFLRLAGGASVRLQ